MSECRARIHENHALPKRRRCELLNVARSTAYYRPERTGEEDLALMRLIDEVHLQWPFYGSRRIRDELQEGGHNVNRKRIQRLMPQMGLQALYPGGRTSQPGKGHKVYPYLLRDLGIERSNQVWAADICYRGLLLTGVLSYEQIPGRPITPNWAETGHNMRRRTHGWRGLVPK